MNEILRHAKDALLHRRAAIQRRHAKTEEELKQIEAGADLDWNERAGTQEDGAILGRVSEEERHELSEINAALARIEAQTFGQCESCGGRIGRQRLRAVPEARYCIACAEEQDLAARKPK